jgi:hypothetical protein
VTAAIVMLWFQPARDWFDGISRPAPSPRSSPRPSLPPSPVQSAHPSAPGVRPDGRDPLLDLPPPIGPPTYALAPSERFPAATVVARRPATVTWACVVTWLCALTTVAVLGLTLVALLADPGIIADARKQNPSLDDAGLSDTVLRNAVLVMAGVVMAWSVVAVVLAVLTWRRVRWAGTALVVCAGAAGALCLLTVIGSFAMLLPLAACAATVALLVRPESRAWLRR